MVRRISVPPIGFKKDVADAQGELQGVFTGFISGELTTSRVQMPLGLVGASGKIVEVQAGVLKSGKNDTSGPAGSFDVKINDTTCLTTKPIVAHISGEASGVKTTLASTTGITDAVIDQTANDVDIGDYLTWEFTYSGETSPTTKLASPFIMVKVQPDN